jgi:hypothetical protein
VLLSYQKGCGTIAREYDYVRNWFRNNIPNGFNPTYCGSRYFCYKVLVPEQESVVKLDDDYYVFSRSTANTVRRLKKKLKEESNAPLFLLR